MTDQDRLLLLRTRDVATLLGVSPRTVRRLASGGRLGGYRLPGGWLFPARNVLETMRTQGVPDAERRLRQLLDRSA